MKSGKLERAQGIPGDRTISPGGWLDTRGKQQSSMYLPRGLICCVCTIINGPLSYYHVPTPKIISCQTIILGLERTLLWAEARFIGAQSETSLINQSEFMQRLFSLESVNTKQSNPACSSWWMQEMWKYRGRRPVNWTNPGLCLPCCKWSREDDYPKVRTTKSLRLLLVLWFILQRNETTGHSGERTIEINIPGRLLNSTKRTCFRHLTWHGMISLAY